MWFETLIIGLLVGPSVVGGIYADSRKREMDNLRFSKGSEHKPDLREAWDRISMIFVAQILGAMLALGLIGFGN